MTVADAMKAELQEVLKGEFNLKSLAKLIRLANAARQFMLAGDATLEGDGLEGRPGGGGNLLMPDPYGSTSVSALGSSSLNSETYGAKMVREIVASLPALMRAQKETPEGLVRAISEAEEYGLTDVANELRGRLGVTVQQTAPIVMCTAKSPAGHSCQYAAGHMDDHINHDTKSSWRNESALAQPSFVTPEDVTPRYFPAPSATPPPDLTGATTLAPFTEVSMVELPPLAPPSGPPIEGIVRAIGVIIEAPDEPEGIPF